MYSGSNYGNRPVEWIAKERVRENEWLLFLCVICKFQPCLWLKQAAPFNGVYRLLIQRPYPKMVSDRIVLMDYFGTSGAGKRILSG
jgi:hypothetical protein